MIEYSADGLDWSPVGNVIAAGNSSSQRSYTFLHNDVFKGEPLHYYRILQRDLDGRSSYSKILAINNREKLEDVIAFPNPTRDLLIIKSAEPQEIRLTNLRGVTIWKGILSAGRNEISVSNLARGAYLLQTNTGIQKVVLQ